MTLNEGNVGDCSAGDVISLSLADGECGELLLVVEEADGDDIMLELCRSDAEALLEGLLAAMTARGWVN
jgi:hypothetical protein